MKYFLDTDNSSHWYLVESSKRREWDEWLDLPEDDERSWESPSFAKRIDGGPSSIDFYLDEPVGQTNKRTRTCPNCLHKISEGGKGHAFNCNTVWGRRGWRQLGEYDG